MKDAMIGCWEAGAVPVEMPQVVEWRNAGHDVPVRWVTVDGYRGPVAIPAIALATAERLAGSLEDEGARDGLAAAVDDMRGYLGIARRRPSSHAVTAARLAGEIVAAVTAGDELPDEWHRLDAYADIGEPIAWEVCRLVREELQGTGITV
jgi:hypothetical protein